MLRAEGAFDEIHAAAVAYLPDDMRAAARAFGIDRSIRHEDDPQWFGVCRHSLGTIALLVRPRFGHELLADPERAVPAVDAAADYATRLGARTLALTGLIPAVTDLGALWTHARALRSQRATLRRPVQLSSLLPRSPRRCTGS